MKKTKRFLLLTLLCGLFLVCFSAPGYAWAVGADGTLYEGFRFTNVGVPWDHVTSLKKVHDDPAVVNMTDAEGGYISKSTAYFNIALSNGPDAGTQNYGGYRIGEQPYNLKSDGRIQIYYKNGGANYKGQEIRMWISATYAKDAGFTIAGTWSPK